MAKRESIAQELLSAWDQGVERALTDAGHTEDLDTADLQSVAGMHIASGLKGGGWTPGTDKRNCTENCPAPTGLIFLQE